MVIAIFRSLEGEALEDFSIRLAERWRIGRKGLDNGVILLVFPAERRVRLEVGYGLEATLTDAAADRIIREVIAPRFRDGRYAAGLEGAVHEVFARIAAPTAPKPPPSPSWLPVIAVAFVVIVIFVVVATTMAGGGHGRGLRRGGRSYTAGPRGWYVPPIAMARGGWGRGGGGGGFSGGGGSFGGGGASGRW